MKNIFKITAAVSAAFLAFMACEEIPDYTTTIDAPAKLTYINHTDGNTFSTLIVHRPSGSTGEFSTEFQVSCNSSDHEDLIATVAYDASLVDSYNQENGTSYVPLPEEYLELENAVVTIAADTTASRDTVHLALSQTADLSLLTERTYLAPLKVTTDGMTSSETMGTLWFIVNTEINLLAPISSEDEIVGYPAGGTSDWTADCGNFSYLFDGSTSSYIAFSYEEDNVLTIDMKDSYKVTGVRLNTAIIDDLSIEYSDDGLTWSQAGTTADGYYTYSGSSWSKGYYCAAIDGYFEARYIRLTFKMASAYGSYGDSYVSVYDIDIYVTDGDGPIIYTVTGSDNVVTSKIVHKEGMGSTGKLNESFTVKTTEASDNGFTVTAAVDNSLVASYNQKNGTSYQTIDPSNVSIANSPVSIASGSKSADTDITLSLTGDLSGYTAEEGYLIPVQLSASGATVSSSRGVVYAVITSENNLIRPISSEDDVLGFPAGGTSTWSADCDNSENLFDGSNSTRVSFSGKTGNSLTVNLGGTHYITGLKLYGYGMQNVTIYYSKDGSSWTSAGTPESDEVVNGGGSWRTGNYIVAFTKSLEAAYIRFDFDFMGSYYPYMYEFSAYEVESDDPTIYAVCGTDNVFSGKIIHHVTAGSLASLSASFNVKTTVSSASGYSVSAEMDNSLVTTYNSAHGTKYATLDASYVQIDGAPCEIAADKLVSDSEISISLTGDLSKLKNSNGYLIPVKLSASGAVTSKARGVVYVVLSVEESDAVFQELSDASSIQGTAVSDRTAWQILECDSEGIYTGTYENLLDGNTTTYVRTWGGPISFTLDMGQEYEMTGCYITARTDRSYYSGYQPTSIQIMGSTDGSTYENFGTATASEGTLLQTTPTSYVSFYGTKTVRYLKIEASYGSNMGTAEFNIYAK